MKGYEPEAGGGGAIETRATSAEDELEFRWREVFEQMVSAERWLASGAVFELKAFRGRKYWCLRFHAVVRGRRNRGTIVIGTEWDTELLRRARLAVNRLRADAVALKCLLRCAKLTARTGRRREITEDFTG